MPIFFLCNSNLGSMSFPPIHQPLGSIHSQGCWCTFHPLHHYFCPYHFCMVPLVWPLGPPWCTKVNNTEKAGRESRPYFVASCRHQLGWIWFFTNGCSPLWRCTRSHDHRFWSSGFTTFTTSSDASGLPLQQECKGMNMMTQDGVSNKTDILLSFDQKEVEGDLGKQHLWHVDHWFLLQLD